MSKIRKQPPPPHIIVPDTSILWHDDKQHTIDPAFNAFLSRFLPDFSLELHIPACVRDELLFQQTTSALKSLKRANDAMSDVSKVTAKPYRHRITEARVRREVESRFDAWMRSVSATLVPTPLAEIDWADLIRKSLWRLPPFTFDPKDSAREKGFRDALILETVKSYCAQATRPIPIAFICRDKLLRDTAIDCLKSNPRFAAYEKYEDFQTYLELTKRKLDDAFIRAIVQRAAEKFFTRGDNDSLYYRDNLRSVLQEKYKKYFDNPEESESRGISFFPSPELKQWEVSSSGTFWIGAPQYVATEEEGVYTWLSTVTFVRLYARPITAIGLSGIGEAGQDRQVLILPFHITWKARVSSDGRFWEYSYVKDELKGKKFHPLTDEDKKNWNLE